MGGKKSAPAAPAPTPQVATPDVDVATLAAEKALAAQGDVRAATQQTAEEEQRGRRGQLGQTGPKPPRPRPERDPAAIANAPAGGMSSSAIITG